MGIYVRFFLLFWRDVDLRRYLFLIMFGVGWGELRFRGIREVGREGGRWGFGFRFFGFYLLLD